jgi:hypothetical protein
MIHYHNIIIANIFYRLMILLGTIADWLKYSLMKFIIFDIAGLVIIASNVIQEEYINCSSYQQYSFEVAPQARMGSVSP